MTEMSQLRKAPEGILGFRWRPSTGKENWRKKHFTKHPLLLDEGLEAVLSLAAQESFNLSAQRNMSKWSKSPFRLRTGRCLFTQEWAAT
ncbi:hypothetical protein PO124_12300 [Bacillus licheniformis]|nr:hypothetical protein [Bacillus licheniformis]